MPDDYYNLPLRLDLLMRSPTQRLSPGQARDVYCTLDESIHNNVYLIITTQFTEARYDPEFGSSIWDDDFRSTQDPADIRWIDQVQRSIKNGIRHYEKRLERAVVEVSVQSDGGSDAHKRITVHVQAQYRQSNQRQFTLQREILIAPFVSKHQ